MKKQITMTMLAAAMLAAPMRGQEFFDAQQVEEAMKKAEKAMKDVDWGKIQADMDRAAKAMNDVKFGDLELLAPLAPLAGIRGGVHGGVGALAPLAGIPGGVLGGLAPLSPGLAFEPQTQVERAQEAAERAREAVDRAREAKDRVRETEDRNIEWYRAGTNSVDERRYERAVDYFDRVINAKWNRADGALYWKAYALNKLGKREEALAALAEIPKQFPQSRWINDAKALQVEIQQSTGQPVSPEAMSDEDLKIMAMNSLVNSEPEKAVPLLEKVLNDPKNNLSLKGRALYVLAQSRSDKARDIVAQYAKNGANQDLQIRAVQYIGSFRMPNSAQILGDVYSSTNDVAVKRAVLRGMANARDAAHLLNAAKSEQNQELRREAIRGLGNMRAISELSQLYPTETSPELKEAIIDSIANARGMDKLVDIAKSEKDGNVRAYAIRRLGYSRGESGEKSGDALAQIYKSEPDKTVKLNIMRALWQSGSCTQLVDVTRNEKDPELRAAGVRDLGMMKGCKEATDLLMEIIAK